MSEKICPNCNKLENLENCFDSNLPLCKECCKQHLNQWKSKANKECLATEASLKFYLNEIGNYCLCSH